MGEIALIENSGHAGFSVLMRRRAD
jgi:hypothetical protein